MAIPDGHRQNFQTLLQAAQAGHLALLECTEAGSGEPVYVLCAVTFDTGTGEYTFTPFARLFKADPYEEWLPPEASESKEEERDARLL